MTFFPQTVSFLPTDGLGYIRKDVFMEFSKAETSTLLPSYNLWGLVKVVGTIFGCKFELR